MASMSINGVVKGQYLYDYAGRQAVRTLPAKGQIIHSVFDSAGNRIAEYDSNGTLLREYVWIGSTPVAVIEGGAVYFVRTDPIGKPVFATNAAGVKVWSLLTDPFGKVIGGTGTPATMRFPGQWFQSESGLHQNWMRDYDPTTGRYLQADPLGLVDGASVYGYARQSPGRYADPRGECIGPAVYVCAAAIGAAVGILEGIIFDAVLGDGCYTWDVNRSGFAGGSNS